MKAMNLFVGHGDGGTVCVVVILIGVGPGIGVEHVEVYGLALAREFPRTECQDDSCSHRRRCILVRSPVGLHKPSGRLDGLLHIHDLFRGRGHTAAHLSYSAANDSAGNGMGARPARVFPMFAIGCHPDMNHARIDLPTSLPVNPETLRDAKAEVVR